MLNADALSSRDGRLLHRSDVAQLLGCSEAEVDRLVTAHQLKSVGTPAGDHFQLQDVAEWISGARQAQRNDQAIEHQRHESRRRGHYKAEGVARQLSSRKERQDRRADGKLTGRWIALYVDLDGNTRQAGIRASKYAADNRSKRVVADLNSSVDDPTARAAPDDERSLLACIDHWPEADDMHTRTAKTNRERALRVCHYFPVVGVQACEEHELALKARAEQRARNPAMTFAPLPPISERAASKLELSDLSRANLLKACKNMRDEGLRRKTIASAFSTMSRLLRKLAEQDPSIVDHAHGIQVIGSPKSYKPKPRRKYRAVPADEVHHFINTYVELVAQPIFWTPAITGARFGELLAINWLKRNPAEQTLVLHEVVDRNGHLESGLKTTHSLAEDEERPTTTLFPEPLAAMYERNGIPSDGYLVRSVTGKFFTHRNFYRDLWGNQPGSKKEGPMTHYQRDGGRRFTPQDLRRSFSSWLGDSGIPQWIIDTWMGHSDPGLETFLGNQRRGSVLMRHYIEEMGSWRPVALEVLTTVMEEGRLPTLRIVRE